MTDELKAQINALVKEHGKRKVKKAVNQLFAEWGEPVMTEKEKEYERIAFDIYEVYPGDGARALTIRNIVKLLKKGTGAEVLLLAADRYKTKLMAEAKARGKVEFEFFYRSHNFFGEKGYWKDFVTEEEYNENG